MWVKYHTVKNEHVSVCVCAFVSKHVAISSFFAMLSQVLRRFWSTECSDPHSLGHLARGAKARKRVRPLACLPGACFLDEDLLQRSQDPSKSVLCLAISTLPCPCIMEKWIGSNTHQNGWPVNWVSAWGILQVEKETPQMSQSSSKPVREGQNHKNHVFGTLQCVLHLLE